MYYDGKELRLGNRDEVDTESRGTVRNRQAPHKKQVKDRISNDI